MRTAFDNEQGPTLDTIRTEYPLAHGTADHVLHGRDALSFQYKYDTERLAAILGPCAFTDEVQIVEAQELIAGAADNVNVYNRLPIWKPRSSDAERFWGMEPDQPMRAYGSLVCAANKGLKVALEIATAEQVRRYGILSSFMWVGARTTEGKYHGDGSRIRLIDALGRQHSLPVGIKNATSGDISSAVRTIDDIARVRRGLSPVAPAILIFRGGDALNSPQQWEKAYIDAYIRMVGKLIVDVAHGTEVAHDVNKEKSVEGQVTAFDHVIELARRGYVPLGVMVETSNIKSPTDPVMPLTEALDRVNELAGIRLAQRTPATRTINIQPQPEAALV